MQSVSTESSFTQFKTSRIYWGSFKCRWYKEILLCSPSLLVGLQQESISFSAVNIFLSITAFLGNFLILVALNKEYSHHPPSKLLYRCLATTNLLVGLVRQPLAVTYWMSLVYKHWSLFWYAKDTVYISSYALLSVFVHVYGHKRGQTSRSVAGNKIKSNRYSQSSVRNFERKLALLNTAKCSPCIVLMHCRKIRNQSHPLK